MDADQYKKTIEDAIAGERGRNFIGPQERVLENLGAATG